MLTVLGRANALGFASLIVPAAILCPAPAFAQDTDDYLGERPERNAMVRYMEGSIKIRKWDAFEDLTIGTPIGEGDIIESSGRGVIQLGDGSRIAFGEGTRLEIATLFDNKDGQMQALFRLDYGRIRVSAGPQSDAYIRVDTASGTLSLENRGNVSLEVGSDRSVRIKVFSGNVAFRNRQDAIRISSGERLIVYSDNERLDRVRSFNTYEIDSFESWAEKHLAYSRSENREHVPSEIRYYADSLNGHGDWVNVVNVGWCWQPRGVVADWRPYWRGHWGAYRGGMTWVSYDPFGYVTHHYGRWGWTSAYGWYWIPGVYYSPAWVAWNIVDSFFGWAPLGYYNRPVYWGYGSHRHDLWNVVHFRNLHARNLYNHTIWDSGLRNSFPSGQTANRSLTAPWSRGPLMVTRQEFSNPDPAQFRRALSREVSSQRLTAYEQQAGRQLVVRRDVSSTGTGAALSTNDRPFEDQSSRRALAERPVLRSSASPEPSREGIRTTPASSNTERRANTADAPRRADTRESASSDTPGRSLDMRDTRRGETRQGQSSSDSNNSVQPQRRSEGSEASRADVPQRSTVREPATRSDRSDSPSRGSSEARDSRGTANTGSNSNAGRQASPAPPPSSSSPARSYSPPASVSSSRAPSSSPARSSAPPDRSRNVR